MVESDGWWFEWIKKGDGTWKHRWGTSLPWSEALYIRRACDLEITMQICIRMLTGKNTSIITLSRAIITYAITNDTMMSIFLVHPQHQHPRHHHHQRLESIIVSRRQSGSAEPPGGH